MEKVKEKCFQCREVLFKKVKNTRTGHTAIEAEEGIKVESEGFTSFMRCPYCRAKNVVASPQNSFGLKELSITHLLDE
jgi:hypothetical protein